MYVPIYIYIYAGKRWRAVLAWGAWSRALAPPFSVQNAFRSLFPTYYFVTMLLFTSSKPLRDRNSTIFLASRPPKPSISLERVVVFQVFAIFTSNGLFHSITGLLGSIFASSGSLRGSSRDHFSWPKRPFLGVHVANFASDPPTRAPGGPKTTPNPPQVPPEPSKRPQNVIAWVFAKL